MIIIFGLDPQIAINNSDNIYQTDALHYEQEDSEYEDKKEEQ